MKNFTNYLYLFFLAFALVNFTIIPSNGQALDKFLNNFEKSVDAVGKTLDNFDKSLTKIDKSIPANKKATTNKNNSTSVNEITQNSNSRKQSKSIKSYSPPKFPDGDLFPLTENLFVNISSKYPSGYEPKWRLVGTTQQLQLNSEVYISKNSKTNTKSIPFGIVEYQGKTVVRMRALDACECVADIDLPNSKTILTNSPTEFELVNFRKVQLKSLDDPNAACKNMSSYTWGGWKGNITLSSDSEGNIKFDVRLENYSNKGNLSWLLYGNDIEMPNMVTPNSAKQTVQKNEIAKIEEKKSEEKRIKEESIKKKKLIVFERELPKVKAKAELNKKIALTYKVYRVPELIDFDKNFPYLRAYDIAEET